MKSIYANGIRKCTYDIICTFICMDNINSFSLILAKSIGHFFYCQNYVPFHLLYQFSKFENKI